MDRDRDRLVPHLRRGKVMESYEHVSWALLADLPPVPRAIGEKAVRLVLVCLANHANTKGLAWPSRSTIASEINGLAPRDVQNALGVLEKGRCLTRVESGKGKRTVYQLGCYLDAGEGDGEPRQVATPRADGAPDVAVDGSLDGVADGKPRHEWNGMKLNTPLPPSADSRGWSERTLHRGGKEASSCSQSLRDALQGYGIPATFVDDVFWTAKADPSTSHPAQRLEKSRQYALQCLETVKGARGARLNTLARCQDHPEEAAIACPPCQADWKVGDRPREFIGRHWPGF